MRYVLLVLVAVLIPACGSSDSGFSSPPVPPILPVAIVPETRKAVIGTAVVLDGSKSYDPVAGAPPPTFLWEQTSGATVTLSGAATNTASFTAPAVLPAAPDNQLVFRLTVSGAQGSSSASVTVTVKTFTVTAPDAWFAGYGVTSQVITPTVNGVAAAPSYLWTGLEPWLSVVATNTLTLTYSTPSITDFQNFPDRAGVLVMERTSQGRLQLKIKVTAGAESDEDFVNFSAGPFADSAANENVALGEPVFLNGGLTIPKTGSTPAGPVTSWTWVGKKPDGTSISFFQPDKTALAGTAQPYIYFVPSTVGQYVIDLTQNNGLSNETPKNIVIVCGKYVGIGSLTGKTPDPFVGECAACHAGQLPWLAPFATTWKDTHHAHVLEEILDPVNPLYTASQAKKLWVDFFNFGSEFSIDSRSVGWSRPGATSNGGWADKATAEGTTLLGIEWADLVRKHPGTAGKSNVQCESCHGPGSEHAGDSTAIRKSYDALVCGRCHASRFDNWESAAHSSISSQAFSSGSGGPTCNGCHTAQGFVVEMRAQEGQDPHPVLFSVSNVNRPVLPFDDRRSQTCQACHEPHKKTVGRPAQPGPDPQLRAWGNVKFRNDVVAFAGEAAVCYMCHQSRRDPRVNSGDWNTRRGPHDSTAAEMLSATNGFEFPGWTYDSSPHADKTRFIVKGQTEARQCLSCHNDVAPNKGETGYLAMGGHTFKLSQGDGTSTINTGTYGAGSTTGGTRQFNLSAAAGSKTLLRKIYTGDILVLSGASGDDGSYIIDSVDGARQVTVQAAGPFTAFNGTVPPGSWTWSITSVPKYNVNACTQCHPSANNFHNAPRDDYDGDGSKVSVQDEIAGLLAALKTAIDTNATTMVTKAMNPPPPPPPTPIPVTFTPGSTIKYTITSSGATRTFPGPGVPSSDNPDILYASLSDPDKKIWDALYEAAYNYMFVVNDLSEGIHNTGYAVNLLQSSYKAVTGSTIGDPFVPK